jgi:hypothetical protein
VSAALVTLGDDNITGSELRVPHNLFDGVNSQVCLRAILLLQLCSPAI